MNEPIDIDALAAALDAAEAPEDPPQESYSGSDPELDATDQGEELEGQVDEAEAGDEPDQGQDGVEKLTVLGPDGEPQDLSLDKILAETMVDVEIDGESRQVNFEELRKGYMLQQDYSKKTAEVAKTREDIAPYAEMIAFAKTDPRFVQYMQAYFVNGGDTIAGMSNYPQVSDEQLSQMLGSDDPETVSQAREIARDRAESSSRAKRAQEQHQQRQEERMRQWEVMRDAGIRRAREVITDYDTQMSGMDDYLAGYGFAPHEISSVADPRYLQVIRDALELRRLRETSTSTKSELATKRKQSRPSRSVRSGRGKPTDSAQTRYRKAEKRAMESGGSTEAWADAIAERFGGFK